MAVRAWYAGDAVAVATPELSKFDRLTVRGPVDDLAPLVTRVARRDGTGLPAFGDERLIRELVERIPELSFVAAFGWMETGQADPDHHCCLARRRRGVEELLDEASPASFAWPGTPAYGGGRRAGRDGRVAEYRG